jgi:hypothetical protein
VPPLQRVRSGLELGHSHKHAGKNVALAPHVLRVVPLEVRPELVAAAIAWLDERWRGGVFVPVELLPLFAAA